MDWHRGARIDLNAVIELILISFSFFHIWLLSIEIDAIDGTDETDKIYEMDKIDEIDIIDEIDKINEIDIIDEIGEIDEVDG